MPKPTQTTASAENPPGSPPPLLPFIGASQAADALVLPSSAVQIRHARMHHPAALVRGQGGANGRSNLYSLHAVPSRLTQTVTRESWPIAGGFTISRGSKTTADVVHVAIGRDGAVGHGECVPYPRYDETVEGTVAELERARAAVEAGCSRDQVPALLGGHAARNALDCALWDLEAKLRNTSAWKLAGLPHAPGPVTTAYTISLGAPEKMADAAKSAASRPLLKVKLGGPGDGDRLRAVRAAAPRARLVIDANEGWQPAELDDRLALCSEVGVELVEQPLPAGNDDALEGLGETDVLICADESAHGIDDLKRLRARYTAINIKLDKTGGLTPALALARAARGAGFEIMIGCMVATSLAMAPAHLIAQGATVVDLDGPLLLSEDRSPGIRYDDSTMHPPPAELWG